MTEKFPPPLVPRGAEVPLVAAVSIGVRVGGGDVGVEGSFRRSSGGLFGQKRRVKGSLARDLGNQTLQVLLNAEKLVTIFIIHAEGTGSDGRAVKARMFLGVRAAIPRRGHAVQVLAEVLARILARILARTRAGVLAIVLAEVLAVVVARVLAGHECNFRRAKLHNSVRSRATRVS